MKKITKTLLSITSSLLIAGNVMTMASCGKETVSGITTGDVDVVAYNGEKVTISFYHCMGSALKDILADGIKYPLEGYLYPETYLFNSNNTMEDVIYASFMLRDLGYRFLLYLSFKRIAF